MGGPIEPIGHTRPAATLYVNQAGKIDKLARNGRATLLTWVHVAGLRGHDVIVGATSSPARPERLRHRVGNDGQDLAAAPSAIPPRPPYSLTLRAGDLLADLPAGSYRRALARHQPLPGTPAGVKTAGVCAGRIRRSRELSLSPPRWSRPRGWTSALIDRCAGACRTHPASDPTGKRALTADPCATPYRE